jgi:hypothetical protein
MDDLTKKKTFKINIRLEMFLIGIELIEFNI